MSTDVTYLRTGVVRPKPLHDDPLRHPRCVARPSNFCAIRAGSTDTGHLARERKVLAAIQDRLDPWAIVINDGGDFLAFGRVGLSTSTMLDPGPFGCIGVGVPYGIAASLAFPDGRCSSPPAMGRSDSMPLR
jgi:thiamine pyrophosphate-dependent acetolactate synthase large subunit-like protein